MPRLLLRTFEETLAGSDGREYTVLACGRERESPERWDGWLEFIPSDGSDAVRSRRETAAPSLEEVESWARGLSLAFAEGSLERTLRSASSELSGDENFLPARAASGNRGSA